MALAARELLSQPALLSIVAMPSAEVHIGGPQSRVIHLTNTNELLSQPGVYGIKTGTTIAAKQCLVTAFRNQDRNVIAVVLGSTDRYADARTLLGLPQPSPAASESSPAE
jgi:D-alanyl-D-alanine carboxypeptidase (penicillin-binding protein 5/6)